jgi:hypothetical protein
MFGLSRLLALTGEVTWRRNCRDGRRRPLPRMGPAVEALEDRVVPTLLGQQLFPSDYPWNQNIANAPVASNSSSIIAHIGTSIKIHPDWGDDSAANGNAALYGIPFMVVHGNSTTKVNVIIDNYPGESDVQGVPIPANAVIEGDFQNGPNNNGGGYNNGQRGDSHMLIWDEDNNIAYELYGVTRPADTTLFPDTNGVEQSHTDGKWHAAQESVWDMKAETFRNLGDTSADAAGLSILAGLARPDEGLPTSAGGQGVINHALRFTLPKGDINPQYIYPASHVVSASSGSNNLPFGSRLRLMNTTAVNNIIAGLGPQAQIIAHAMQQYGLVLADIGSAMYVTGASASEDANNAINFTWNMNDVLGLAGLNAGDFEVVNLSPVVTSLSASTGSSGNTITINGQNFSGSAGHLSVFFGSTAASTVTYVGDTQITAKVPAGSGTVDVTVQSGVNKTDPNNPNDNVNAPIFGYGTSATSSADRFTFTSQTVSAGNSSASFATSSVVTGNTDTLTIVVKDTTNAIISGLGNSAFGFSLSGGASAGTFGTVTESSTKGTYTTAFTGTTIGTASTVTIKVSGVTLTSQPTITVNAASGSPTAPSNLSFNTSAALASSSHLSLQWTDNSSNETSFLIDRSTDGTNFTQITSVGANVTTYKDVNLAPGTKYYYRVRASNANGNSAYTNVASAKTLTGNEQWVHALYEDFIGREGSLAEWDAWVNILPSMGVAGVVNSIARSTEALKRQVDSIYTRFLNRQADTAGENFWIQYLQQGNTEEQLINQLLGSQEFFVDQGSTNSGFVKGLYQLLLNRTPATSEVNAWVNVVPAIGRSGVATSFTSSGEYRTGAVRTFYGDPSLSPKPFEPYFTNLLHRTAAPASQEIQGWVSTSMDSLTIETTLAETVEYIQSAQKR